MLSLSKLAVELEALEVLKQAFKARSMVYDIKTKEMTAWLSGLPINTYYYMNYYDWIEIRK